MENRELCSVGGISMNEYCVCMLTPENEQIRFTTFAHNPDEAEQKARRYIPCIIKIVATHLMTMAF